MGDDAGFAAAITLREGLLKDVILVAYAGGSFPRTLDTSKFPSDGQQPAGQLPGGPPQAGLNMFLGPPLINCHTNNTLSIALRMWGQLSVTMNAAEEGATVDAQLLVRLVPTFVIVRDKPNQEPPSLELRPALQNVTVSQWDFTVISPGGFSPAADSYLRSSAFRDRLQMTIRGAIALNLVSLPQIDISFLGDALVRAVEVTAASRVRQGSVMIGLSIQSDDVTLVGNAEGLSDFADSNDLAAITHKDAVPILLQAVSTAVSEKVSEKGATLEPPLNIKPGEGRFLISGKASNTEGSATFSFALIPTYYGTRSSQTFPKALRDVHVNFRTWPALGFAVADVKVSIDLAFWVDLIRFMVEPFVRELSILIGSMVRKMTAEIAGAIEGYDPTSPTPRVRRLKPKMPGGATVRVEIAEYRITKKGTYIGIRITPESLPGALIGVTSIPADLRAQELLYTVRLPLGVGPDDPKLRIRWTVINPGTGEVLMNEDGQAADRLTFSFVPEIAGPGLGYLRVAVRVYRALGPQIAEFVNDGITLEMRGPLPLGAYVRWWYTAKNPQVLFDEEDKAYAYAGDALLVRHSNIHRTDRPCVMANKQSRYAYRTEFLDALPFQVSEILSRRRQLCDYCFYGGPAGMRPSL
jgi:hypothetical protein